MITVIVVGLIAVGIVIASAHTGTATLKRSRKQWKKKKAKNPEWQKTKPWE
jgi:cell division protein FtsL